MGAADMPAAEVDIDTGLVERLVAKQYPQFTGLRIEPLASGWDNALYRLGEELVVRLPRRQLGVPLIEHEQRWLPELAPRLPLPIPAPVHVGVPDLGYPWRWSICPYFPGKSALALIDDGGAFPDPVAEARRLGSFLAALHRPAPSNAPHNPLRGVPLAERQDRFDADLDRVAGEVDVRAIRDAWASALALRGWAGSPVWVHGDVHPGNLITDGEHITAVIDLGDLCAGDPASDLAVAWMLFDGAARSEFRDAVAVDGDTWRRGLGWALCIGLALTATSADNPPYERLGRRTLDAALADADADGQ